ncbi:CRISPR-associated helicase/endonuclease Cas3 [Xylanimonas oleitrophica]|uniref:CRISPR-associated helicase/endonuclease Cas3 n=1 Tax=Xylanimonas oleitrophica TaxID=2607479 RepID=A0A2W5WLY1_9MICO|nr:CRISPR-associated helicase Cas3' [Xylanimonas oleitrophica]PZR51713.1 CRISPR-associated helicase/endonuclease Cas3 [Xylanimonas oleitrophica]
MSSVAVSGALSEQARTVWAKSWPMHGREIESWLPLWQHLHDAAGIAGRLWDEWLPPIVTRQIAEAAGGDEAGRALLSFLAGVHDVGKATPAFAVQVGVLRDELVKSGLEMPQVLPDRAQRPHGLAGQVIVEAWLESRFGWSTGQARALASVVGGHHGIPPSTAEADDARTPSHKNAELLGAGPWRGVQAELLDHMAARTGAAERLGQQGWRSLPRSVLVLALSVVVVADWLASNRELFPLASAEDRPLAQPDGDDEARLRVAWAAVDLPRPWSPAQVELAADELLRARFELPGEVEARPVQRAAVAAAREMDAAGILVVEAPMGEGKTEAAMLAAEVLAARTGAGGVLVALPTQATSDAMFARVMRWVASQPRTYDGGDIVRDGAYGEGGDRRAVFLAHDKAWLNPDFAAVPRATPVLDVGRDEEAPVAGARAGAGGAYVDGWMRGRRKGVLADFVVGTIDQVLFGALKSRHVALRHLALARKVVVLDEIHSFDTYMNEYLERALEWLGAYGVPVVALSATLPASLCDRLVQAYAKGADSRAPLPSAGGQRPRRSRWGSPAAAGARTVAAETAVVPTADPPPSSVLTYLKDGQPQRVVPEPSSRVSTVRLEVAAEDAWQALLREALADGGCALVVRNTVGRAQDTYRELRDLYAGDGETTVMLLHSRFLASDRKRREAELVRLLGKPTAEGDPRPHRLVVVGTQVVEQSLDIDVDLLVTDLAPTDLLLQRIGRLHRHQERPARTRPERVREPRTVVVGVEDWVAQPPVPVRGSSAVYGDHLLLRAAAQVLDVVQGSGTLRLPQDIAPLVQQAYDDGLPLGPEEWQPAMRKARVAQGDVREVQRARARAFQLPGPGAGSRGLAGWLDGSVGEADVVGARAQVRDSEDSIEVIVVQADGADQWRVPDWFDGEVAGAQVPRGEIPSLPLRRAIAGATVRLPASMSRGRGGDAVIDHLERLAVELDLEAWQRSPDLAGQLVLPLDDERRARIPGWALTYDRETGLSAERLA